MVHDTWKRRGVSVALPTLLLVSSPGCQSATKFGVLNECARAIEADIESVAEPSNLHFVVIQPGAGKHLRSIGDTEAQIYVWVRNPSDNATPEPFPMMVSDVGRPVADAPYEREIVIEGDRCPTDNDE